MILYKKSHLGTPSKEPLQIKANVANSSVTINAIWRNDIDATYNWVYGVASSGIFKKPSSLMENYGPYYIPNNWTVVNI